MPFNRDERRLLLGTPRIGPLVVTRLEQAGYDSLAAIHQAGPAQVVQVIADLVGSAAWGNRRAAIERALAQATHAQQPVPPGA